MEIHVRVAGAGLFQLNLPDGATADDLTRALGMRPATAVVLVEGVPVPGETPIEPGSRVEVLRVVTGG